MAKKRLRGSNIPFESAGTSPPAGSAASANPLPGADYFYYQSADGQWLFLHPLCMRALVAASGGSYEDLPRRVAGRLLEVEGLVQSPVVRKRLKLLAHLPLTGARASPVAGPTHSDVAQQVGHKPRTLYEGL